MLMCRGVDDIVLRCCWHCVGVLRCGCSAVVSMTACVDYVVMCCGLVVLMCCCVEVLMDVYPVQESSAPGSNSRIYHPTRKATMNKFRNFPSKMLKNDRTKSKKNWKKVKEILKLKQQNYKFNKSSSFNINRFCGLCDAQSESLKNCDPPPPPPSRVTRHRLCGRPLIGTEYTIVYRRVHHARGELF